MFGSLGHLQTSRRDDVSQLLLRVLDDRKPPIENEVIQELCSARILPPDVCRLASLCESVLSARRSQASQPHRAFSGVIRTRDNEGAFRVEEVILMRAFANVINGLTMIVSAVDNRRRSFVSCTTPSE